MSRTRNPWVALAVLAVAQFMVVLDVTIVNVALPDIQTGLHFSANGLQWVVSAYTLLFGGLMLLGGRAADLLGRRRLFVVGLAIFGLSSLGAGLAGGAAMLVVLRAVQGLGAAIMSPAALALVTVTFAHGRERNIALGIWSALAGIGGISGAVIGGALVDGLSWRWVFFVNVPVAAALVLLSMALIAESRVEAPDGRRAFDVPGAVLGTAGAFAIVLGVVQAGPKGWGSAEVIGLLLAGVVMLTGFVLVERRAQAPLIPLSLFRSRGLSVSTVSLALNGATFLGMFFLTAIFFQEVRGYSALRTGINLVPMGITAVLGAVVASSLVERVGTRTVQLTGALLSLVGLAMLTQVSATSSYAGLLLPALAVLGLGISGIGVPSQINGIADVRHEHAGAASGTIQTGFQVGGAIGIAIIDTLSTSHVTHLLGGGADPVSALIGGYDRGLLVAVVLAGVNLLVALAAPQLRPTPELVAASAAA